MPLPSSKSVPLGPGKRPTIKRESRGPYVVEWQKFLGVGADGIFGGGTEAATRAFQSSNGLAADGIVGNASWTKAIQLSTQTVATQAAREVTNATQVIREAKAAAPPTAKAKAAAAKTAAVRNVQAAATSVAEPMTKPKTVITPVTQAAKKAFTDARAGVSTVRNQATALKLKAPLWARAAFATGAAFTVLVGAKLLMKPRRAA